jgi:hypothetical protein
LDILTDFELGIVMGLHTWKLEDLQRLIDLDIETIPDTELFLDDILPFEFIPVYVPVKTPQSGSIESLETVEQKLGPIDQYLYQDIDSIEQILNIQLMNVFKKIDKTTELEPEEPWRLGARVEPDTEDEFSFMTIPPTFEPQQTTGVSRERAVMFARGSSSDPTRDLPAPDTRFFSTGVAAFYFFCLTLVFGFLTPRLTGIPEFDEFIQTRGILELRYFMKVY